MKNKVLCEIYIPQIDETFNVFLPLNKNVANIILLVCKSISEFKRIENMSIDSLSLYNQETSLKYQPDKLIRETNIRNGVRLLLM